MKNGKKKPGGIYSYIVKNFVGFVLASIVILVLCYFVGVSVLDKIYTNYFLGLGYSEELINGDSDDLLEAQTAMYKEAESAPDYGSFKNTLYTVLIIVIFMYFVLLALVVAIAAFKMKRRIVKPLGTLNEEMEQLSLSDLSETELQSSGLTEFDEITMSFERMTDRLKESEKERRSLEEGRAKMLADISHDLKTPITVIQGYSKAVLDGIADEETKKRYITAIYNKSQMMSDLINSFHEFSKLDHPQFMLNIERHDICEYFREYLAMRYEELELAGCELETDLPEEEVIISFDSAQMNRVFENIINNSLRHNKGKMTIFSGLNVTEDAVIIRLGDDGIGIPAAIREHIFEPFVTGNEARTSGGGSGLGMAISKKIVEAHGGELVLMPGNENGTTYEIRLPVGERPVQTKTA